MKKILTVFLAISIIPVLLLSATNNVYAEENMTDSEEPKFLAIQNAQSGSLSEINTTTYTLELNDISDKTILFSDRPDRIVTSVSTSDFIGNWTADEDSFVTDAPNAVLVVDEQEGIQDIAIIELFNPVYDIEKKTLRYDVTLDNSTSIELQNKFGQSSLVLDDEPAGITVVSSVYLGS